MEGAKIHAENSIRQKNQSLNYRRMSARIDAVAARVQTAITTKQVCLSCLTTLLSFLWPSDRASHYILPLWFLLSFVLFFLAYSQWLQIGCLHVYHTSTHDVALVQI